MTKFQRAQAARYCSNAPRITAALQLFPLSLGPRSSHGQKAARRIYVRTRALCLFHALLSPHPACLSISSTRMCIFAILHWSNEHTIRGVLWTPRFYPAILSLVWWSRAVGLNEGCVYGRVCKCVGAEMVCGLYGQRVTSCNERAGVCGGMLVRWT